MKENASGCFFLNTVYISAAFISFIRRLAQTQILLVS